MKECMKNMMNALIFLTLCPLLKKVFYCLKATELLQGDSLLFTKSLEIPAGTYATTSLFESFERGYDNLMLAFFTLSVCYTNITLPLYLKDNLNKINANVLCFYLWFKLYAIEAKYNWAIPEKKQTNRVGLRTYFFEKFFTLSWKFQTEGSSNWKFRKIVLDLLEIPRTKTKTPENSTLFFLGHP